MSIPRLDFEVALIRELTRIGTTNAEAQDYVEGMRCGGALVFATGSDERVEAAIDIITGTARWRSKRPVGPNPTYPVWLART